MIEPKRTLLDVLARYPWPFAPDPQICLTPPEPSTLIEILVWEETFEHVATALLNHAVIGALPQIGGFAEGMRSQLLRLETNRFWLISQEPVALQQLNDSLFPDFAAIADLSDCFEPLIIRGALEVSNFRQILDPAALEAFSAEGLLTFDFAGLSLRVLFEKSQLTLFVRPSEAHSLIENLVAASQTYGFSLGLDA